MKFYRYEITHREHTPLVNLRELDMIKETKCGYWIAYGHMKWKVKWVNKKSKSRWAYPSKEEAMTNFIKRTERRLQFLKRDLRFVEMALKSVTTPKTN